MEFIQNADVIYCLLPIVGFIVGMFGTLTGGGGGFFFLPYFTLLMHLPAQSAILNTLLASIPLCLAGTLRNYRNGFVNRTTVLSFALYGIIGVVLGAAIAIIADSSILKTAFGVYALILAFSIVLKTKRTVFRKYNSVQSDSQKSPNSWIYGISAGFITGTFGASGSGPIMAGLFNQQLPIKKVIGTSLFLILINISVASAVHIFSGNVNLIAIGLITTGSVPGSVIGAKILSSVRIDKHETTAKYLYAGAVAIIGLMMIK